MDKGEAQRILCGVDGERCFWVNNGPVLRNLDELYTALSEMGKDTFSHHVSNEKNDFSAWIGNALGDQKLAEDIAKARSKKGMAAKVKQRLQYLKKAAA